MNRRYPFVFLLTILNILVSSCSETGLVNDCLNIDSLEQEYKTFFTYSQEKKDSILDRQYEACFEDSLASPLGNPQGLCCLSNWQLQLSYSKADSTVTQMQTLYNAYAYVNSIWADYEILERSVSNGDDIGLVSHDSILYAISNIKADILENKTYKNHAQDFKTDFINCQKNRDRWTDTYCPGYFAYKYDSLVCTPIVTVILKDIDVKLYYSYVDSVISKASLKCDVIRKSPEEQRFMKLLEIIKSASSFEEQCAILVASCSSKSTFNGAWSLKLMETFMESGHYSLLLERLWVIWRALNQQEMCGMSRDSYIPNYYYDKYRNKVFQCVLKELVKDPTDFTTCQAVLISTHTCLLRNGKYTFGNDAAIDIMCYCPDFWK